MKKCPHPQKVPLPKGHRIVKLKPGRNAKKPGHPTGANEGGTETDPLSKIETNPATIAALRAMMREGTCEMEERMTNKIDTESAKVHAKLYSKRDARRVWKNACKHSEKKKTQPARSPK